MSAWSHRIARGVIAALVAVSVEGAGAEKTGGVTNAVEEGARLHLAVDLVDGSRLVGKPAIRSMSVRTAYARLDITLDQILNVRVQQDRQTAQFTLRNGDTLTGALNLKPLGMRTIFGEVSVGSEHIAGIQVFRAPRPLAPGETPFQVLATGNITVKPYPMFAAADFNGDGLLDVAISDTTEGVWSVDVYLNNGRGALVLKARYPVGNFPQHIVAGDFNEDGHPDLLVAVYLGSLGDGTLNLFTGNGDGTFAIGSGFSAKVGGKGQNPIRMAVADLNLDGHLDVVVEMNNDWALNVHWGKGDGTFTPKYSLRNGQNPGNTEIADLNGDGWPDIVSGSLYTFAYVHLSDGAGGYRAPVEYLRDTPGCQPVVIGDADGDGDVDIVVVQHRLHTASLLLNDGRGSFVSKGRLSMPEGALPAAIGDLDADGRPEIVHSAGARVLVARGKGDGAFEDPVAYDMGHRVDGLQLHDADQDGRPDFVYIDADNHRLVMRRNTAF